MHNETSENTAPDAAALEATMVAAYRAKEQITPGRRKRLLKQFGHPEPSIPGVINYISKLNGRPKKPSVPVLIAWIAVGEKWFVSIIKWFHQTFMRRVYLHTRDLVVGLGVGLRYILLLSQQRAYGYCKRGERLNLGDGFMNRIIL